MVPPPPPQQVQQPYYPYQQQAAPHARADMTAFITRRIVFVVVAIGGLLVWVALLGLGAFNVADPGVVNLLQAVGITGTFMGFGASLLGALGSKQTEGNQNLGLLVLAGFFFLALALNPTWLF